MTSQADLVHVGDIARQMVMDFGLADPAPAKPARSKPAKISPIVGDWCWRLHPGASQGGFLYRVRHLSPDWHNLFVPASYLRQRLEYNPDTGALTWRDHADMLPHVRSRLVGKRGFASRDTGGYRFGKITVPHVGPLQIMAHRVAWAISYGYWPRDQIDHVNRDRADNRLSNLREATRSENRRNQSCDGSAGKNPALGVVWNKTLEKWQAQIFINGKMRYLGGFTSLADAVRARCEAERAHGWPKAALTDDQRVQRALYLASRDPAAP